MTDVRKMPIGVLELKAVAYAEMLFNQGDESAMEELSHYILEKWKGNLDFAQEDINHLEDLKKLKENRQ